MSSLINQVILFLLLSCYISTNDNEIEILLNILDCVEKDSNINKTEIISLKKVFYNNYNPSIILKIYDYLQDNVIIADKCIRNIKDIPYSITNRIYPFYKQFAKYNWMAFANCLINSPGNAPDNSIKYLLDYIYTKNYLDAFDEERRLIKNRNRNVLICSRQKIDETNFEYFRMNRFENDFY